MKEGTFAVVLDAKTEAGLIALAAKLKLAGIPHVVVREPDEPYDNAVTAIGVEPLEDLTVLRRLTSSLPLYGKPALCRECEEERGIYTCNGGRRTAATKT